MLSTVVQVSAYNYKSNKIYDPKMLARMMHKFFVVSGTNGSQAWQVL